MNILECYIVKIFEERELTEEERAEFTLVNPDELIFVKWEYNCYETHTIVEDYVFKTVWEEIKRRGYALR